MPALAIASWVLLRLITRPWVLGLLVALTFLVPVTEPFRPAGGARSPLDTALAWCFPAGLLAVTLGLTTLSRGEEFLGYLEPRSRWAGELGALLAAALVLQFPIVVGAAVLGAPPLQLARALPDILTADLRLAGLALLLLLPELSAPLRALLFLSATWVLPGMLVDGSPGSHLFDAGATLRPHPTPALLSGLAVALALALAGFLLRVRPRPSFSR